MNCKTHHSIDQKKKKKERTLHSYVYDSFKASFSLISKNGRCNAYLIRDDNVLFFCRFSMDGSLKVIRRILHMGLG